MLRNASTLGDSILLIATLCFHSVFEGSAIGVAGRGEKIWLWLEECIENKKEVTNADLKCSPHQNFQSSVLIPKDEYSMASSLDLMATKLLSLSVWLWCIIRCSCLIMLNSHRDL